MVEVFECDNPSSSLLGQGINYDWISFIVQAQGNILHVYFSSEGSIKLPSLYYVSQDSFMIRHTTLFYFLSNWS